MIWGLHNLQYLIAYHLHKDDSGEFTTFVYKGPFGYADVLSYASLIKYSGENPSLYRPDPLIYENSELYFADGNLMNVYTGLVYKIVGDIDQTVYFGSILCIFLSVLLIYYICDLLFENRKLWLYAGISMVLLCSNFDDLFGLSKLIEGYFMPTEFLNDVLVLGYNQRFPYTQFSMVILLFWIFQFLKWQKNGTIKNQLLLGFSIILCHYTYFYYWTVALALTAGVAVLQWKRLKEWMYLLVVYALLSSHFWYQFVQFSISDFSKEYLERVKGVQVYRLKYIYLFGTLTLLPFLKFYKHKVLTVLTILAPPLGYWFIGKVAYELQPEHWFYGLSRVVFLCGLLGPVLLQVVINKVEGMKLIALLNYYLIFLLCSLWFVVGYNIQPYHWVYASFYFILIIGLLTNYHSFFATKKGERTVLIIASIILLVGVANSYKFAERNFKFWTLSTDDQEVISFFETKENVVISGNNIVPLISFTAHSDLQLFRGSTSHKRSSYPESYFRFIHPFDLMGYDNESIEKEYLKFKGYTDYFSIYNGHQESKRDSLAQIWPDNITLTAEGLHCYFLDEEERFPLFQKELQNYNADTYNFKLDYLVIYTSTFLGDYSKIKGELVLSNPSFKIYKLNL